MEQLLLIILGFVLGIASSWLKLKFDKNNSLSVHSIKIKAEAVQKVFSGLDQIESDVSGLFGLYNENKNVNIHEKDQHNKIQNAFKNHISFLSEQRTLIGEKIYRTATERNILLRRLYEICTPKNVKDIYMDEKENVLNRELYNQRFGDIAHIMKNLFS